MEILKNIKAAVENTLKILKIEVELVVSDSFIEIEVDTLEEAQKIEEAFKKCFSDVELFDLSEIDEQGYMVNIRF